MRRMKIKRRKNHKDLEQNKDNHYLAAIIKLTREQLHTHKFDMLCTIYGSTS